MAQDRHRYWVWGLLYGLALMFWSFAAAGGGHGTYIMLGLSSSPLGWLGIAAAFFGLPVLWAAFGFLLGESDKSAYKLLFLALAVAHYVNIFPLLSREMFGDWGYFNKVLSVSPVGMISGVATYLGGQVAMWVAYWRVVRPS